MKTGLFLLVGEINVFHFILAKKKLFIMKESFKTK